MIVTLTSLVNHINAVARKLIDKTEYGVMK